MLITILLLCSVDLISQILVYQFHEFGYCIYMIMVVGFLSAIYFAFLADPSPKSDRQTDADNPANKSQRKLDGKSTDRNSTITLYIYECVILLTAGFLHLTLFPEERGTMFLLLLVLLPMLIFDQFWRVCLMILSISVIYILFSVSVLSLDKAGSDIVYTNIAAVVSLIWTGGVIRHRTNTLHSNEISETSAAHDGLTGIYNRKGGDAVINNCILNGIPGAFIILDVDYFKHVNDTYGHQIGDRVLKEVADCLTRSFRKEDIVTRLGGDEFVVYAVRMADRTYVTKKLTEVLENMRKIPICEADHDYVTVSIGCAINDGTYLDYNALYTLADHMLYITKNSGKNSFHITDRSFSGQPVQHTHS
ncbi:MAG: GGDEF domain-containing protein [Eubacterium sp.]|nr:GGDEF domain-containing protein [Eubacterium sp.]